jgi:hypothetical protein
MHIEVSTFSSHDAPTKVIFYKGAKQSIEILNSSINFQAAKFLWDIIHSKDSFSENIVDKLESSSLGTMLASEKILGLDWDSPGEDEAWENL